MRQTLPTVPLTLLTIGTTLVLALSGCSGSDGTSPQGEVGQEDESAASQPKVSEEGQIAFACSLAEIATEDGIDDPGELFGDEPSSAAVNAVSAASLSGGAIGLTIADRTELSEAGQQVIEAISSTDLDATNAGLNAMVTACEDVPDREGPSADDQDYRTAYACTLADHIVQERGSASSWELPDDPGLREAYSVAALVGGVNSTESNFVDELTPVAKEILSAFTRLDTEALDEQLAEFVSVCV